MLTNFHFLQPYWLLLIPVVFVLAYVVLKQRVNRVHWEAVCDSELLPFLEKKADKTLSLLPVSLIIAAVILVVAVAQPVWKKQPQPVFKQGDALVIALDLSASMIAEDIKPTRLQRAHFKIEDVLMRMPDTQAALLVYAADAFSVTPLTDDSDTILAQLPAMTPDIMPAQGSRADKAILLADQLLTQAGIAQGNILLISDEVLPAQIASVASRLKHQGRQISILAVGTEQGAPIKTHKGLLKNRSGQVIVAKTRADLMQESAALGGGAAAMITADDTDINALMAQFQQGETLPVETKEKIERWVAEGPWLILFALPLVLMIFRKGVVAICIPLLLPALLGVAGYSEPLHAESPNHGGDKEQSVNLVIDNLWRDLWQTRDQQAMTLYESGDKGAAAEKFDDLHWKQRAYYENQQYDQALSAVGEPKTAGDWYNQGNIFARQGMLEQALSSYDKAIDMLPDFENAIYNRQVIESLLQQQEQQSGQNGQTPPDDKKKDGDSQNGSEENSEQEGKESKKGAESGRQNQEKGNDTQGSSSNDSNTNGTDKQSEGAEASPRKDDAESNEKNEQIKNKSDEQLQQTLKNKMDQQLEKSSPESPANAENDVKEQEQTTKDHQSDTMAAQATDQPFDEDAQARQQLLNRIEDDPAGLWRRKFIYQYRQQSNGQAVEEKQW